LLVGGRLVQLQVVHGDDLAHRARQQSERVIRTPGPRGDVVDRQGRLLAISYPVKTLAVEPRRISREGLAALERVTSRRGRLVGHADKPWREVRRDCDQACEGAVKELVERGVVPATAVHWADGFERRYPMRDLAAPTIGFLTADRGIAEGIEGAYDELLRSPARQSVRFADALGSFVEVLDAGSFESTTSSLMLTIDARIQRVLERALRRSITHHDARGGQGVVMVPDTGEVLALASLPTFDANEYQKASRAAIRNDALASAFELGSVLKPLVAASLVEHRVHEPTATVDAEDGMWRDGRRVFRDVKPHGRMTLAEAIAVSSNIAMVKFSRPLSAAQMHRTLTRFGLGSATDVDFPFEARGILKKPSRWRSSDKDSVAFGYSLSATPLQLAVAYATIANGGRRPTPRLARAFGSPDGSWHALPATRPAAAISRRTADLVTEWLVDVVHSDEGTGSAARVAGFTVAGKTGTARKLVDGEYDATKLRASFAGFVPADAPEIVVVVSIDEPREHGRGGGAVAAPCFAEIARETLRLMRVAAPRADRMPLVAAAEASSSDDVEPARFGDAG
jgi:cell division protein FtsI (penicillin-binding protein 3)